MCLTVLKVLKSEGKKFHKITFVKNSSLLGITHIHTQEEFSMAIPSTGQFLEGGQKPTQIEREHGQRLHTDSDLSSSVVCLCFPFKGSISYYISYII